MSAAACVDTDADGTSRYRVQESRQFQALYHNFLRRIIDLELLSGSGDVRHLLAQFASLLAAYSFVVALLSVSHFAASDTRSSTLLTSAWGMEEFLISTTLTIAGLFAVLAWNSILPDRRDSFILSPLPVRTRTIFGAKGAATAILLGISIVAVNVFTGISFPFLAAPTGSGLTGALRCFLAYWMAMAAAGAFIFISIFALQNVAAACFGYRFFQRISGWLQLLAFFVILALFFLTPPLATPTALNAPQNQHLLAWLPSFWFLGLFHELNGTAFPAFAPLASRAVLSLAAVCLLSLATVANVSSNFTRSH